MESYPLSLSTLSSGRKNNIQNPCRIFCIGPFQLEISKIENELIELQKDQRMKEIKIINPNKPMVKVSNSVHLQ